jgi:hypothetical protein
VESDEEDEALGLGLDIEDDSRNEEGRRNGRGEGVSERGRLSRASVTAASEGGDVGGFSRPLSRASVTAASEGGGSRSSSRASAAGSNTSTRRRPQTHMTPMSRPRTRQQGNTTLDSSPGDRIGNMIAMMMMNQASESDERRSEQEERREEFRLQMEMQRQQMQQQQSMMTILLMNAMGVTGVNSQQTTQQLGIGINSTSTTSINNIQQQEHGREDGKSGEE